MVSWLKFILNDDILKRVEKLGKKTRIVFDEMALFRCKLQGKKAVDGMNIKEQQKEKKEEAKFSTTDILWVFRAYKKQLRR